MTRVRTILAMVALPFLAGCERAPPPGAEPAAEPIVLTVIRQRTEGDRENAVGQTILGTPTDNLPFAPTGEKLASIAWRTWIYTDTGPQRTRYGYLRAGAVVDIRGPEIRNPGCEDGWYRINPRGFVCAGKGATRDLDHPVVLSSWLRPRRGEGLPYLYALAREPSPHLYFRLPTAREMAEVEGRGYLNHAVTWRSGLENAGLLSLVAPTPEPPAFIRGASALEKPYGIDPKVRYATHAGQSGSDSGFALLHRFEWESRLFGLTTELDLIALDRTRVVRPSEFHGVSLDQGEDLPVAVVERPWISRFDQTETGQGSLTISGSLKRRTVIKLTGETLSRGGKFWRAREGFWVPDSGVKVLEKRSSFPSIATGSRKWIDISIRHQTLVAYTGEKADYATVVSTGAGGLGDPEETSATVQGTFMIYAKHVSGLMDGEEDKSDSFNLRDVPFIQYFHKGYALHGTYWHEDFGRARSHGCVNLSPIDAAWLFEWTDPAVPPDWHAALNKERGTAVYIHP